MTKHIPGHHGRGMEASGPILKSGEGYREIIATPTKHREHLAQCAVLYRQQARRAIEQRERDIDQGLVHQTPAMAEATSEVVK